MDSIYDLLLIVFIVMVALEIAPAILLGWGLSRFSVIIIISLISCGIVIMEILCAHRIAEWLYAFRWIREVLSRMLRASWRKKRKLWNYYKKKQFGCKKLLERQNLAVLFVLTLIPYTTWIGIGSQGILNIRFGVYTICLANFSKIVLITLLYGYLFF